MVDRCRIRLSAPICAFAICAALELFMDSRCDDNYRDQERRCIEVIGHAREATVCANRDTWYPRGLTCSNTEAQHLFQVGLYRDSSNDERTSLNSNIDSRLTSSCNGNLRHRAQCPQPDTPEQLLPSWSEKRDLPTYRTHVCMGYQFDDHSSLYLSKRYGRNTLQYFECCRVSS